LLRTRSIESTRRRIDDLPQKTLASSCFVTSLAFSNGAKDSAAGLYLAAGRVAHSDGHDSPGLIGELVPSRAIVVHDVVEGFEAPISEPVVA
jgi:hypothetical protein